MRYACPILAAASVVALAASAYAESVAPPSLAEILRPLIQRETPAPEPPQPPVEPTKAPGRVIALADVVEALTGALNRNLSEDERIEMSSTAAWTPLPLEPDAAWELSLKNSYAPSYQGLWTAHFGIKIDGEAVGNWRLPMQTTHTRKVWMAGESLGREAVPVSPQIYTVEMLDARLPDKAIAASTDLSGYELARPVSVNRVLTWDDVRVRPAIRRGDIVQVNVNHGALSIRMPAVALEDGQVGDQVRLRNIDTSREISGTVTESQKVNIQLRKNHETP
ncbi:flagellar basal body P-ring formation protein FlgA [Ruficoccus amylovorans]|uniref:Flagellar basal body P-ring formation protein FlgA n=1 Tax=Ruficoccus amylovorans TaxID=1804625 RepID=A0A842HF32_9BACT|nr:flagellar basal body P-ring formation chaperone FlgA [Ruficoccus amylovorans]MBC2595032.1 flagellar basal body P-ring formation protein FlgA [Ruficoccus amylovorans]